MNKLTNLFRTNRQRDKFWKLQHILLDEVIRKKDNFNIDIWNNPTNKDVEMLLSSLTKNNLEVLDENISLNIYIGTMRKVITKIKPNKHWELLLNICSMKAKKISEDVHLLDFF